MITTGLRREKSMRNLFKTILGIGVVAGMVLLTVGFFRYLCGEPYRIMVLVGTILCVAGCGYAQREEGEPDGLS